ncbi:MAG: ABC transporter ATP-binding protein/permease [Oscillospiraceae bacterium]|jgi:ABC-type multidrug transport system fused ATPase/permease subunit|nr:ABC transporter ATP-binding protein/permease [Oscillospiraceae bacterium]
MRILKELNSIFNRKTKIKLFILLVAIIIGATLEVLALSIISPLISVLLDNETIYSNELTNFIYYHLGFSSINTFLAFLAFILFTVYIIRGIYLYILAKIQYNFIARKQSELSIKILEKIQSNSYLYHTGKNIAELQRIVLGDVHGMFLSITAILLFLTDAFMVLFIMIYLLIISPIMTLCVVTLAGICLFLYFAIFRRLIIYLGQKNRASNINMTKSVNQALGGIKEVKVLQREAYFRNIFKKSSDSAAKTTAHFQLLSAMPVLIIETVCFGGTFLFLSILIFSGVDISYLIPQLSIFVLAAFRLLPALSRQASKLNAIIFQRPAIDGVYKTLNVDNHSTFLPPKQDISSPSIFSNNIDIYNISFQYPHTQKPVLENVLFTIPENKSIALIGTTGSGKTTLIDLILGIIAPNNGCISYKGMYSTLDRIWSKSFGYIPQQIYLLDETILKNVAFGIDENMIEEIKVWKALEQAQIADFVRTLPDGLETIIGDRGIRLSGGQRQRISIARALYEDPPILVLDEATSSLDDDTETAVMEAITGFHGKKTIIIVAHRLSTIEHCDIVYKVDNGNVRKISK